MHSVVIPLIDKSFHAALKRSRDETSYWNGGGPPGWASNKKKNAAGGWMLSQSSTWQAPSCSMCYGQFKDTETSDWKTAWERDLEHPCDWKTMPADWYSSCYSNLSTQRDKAAKEKQTKPNDDEATLSLVQCKLEGALYDPCKPYDNSRFLLLHMTSKLVTLGCYYCRKMSTLNYSVLEPRDGKLLHQFFDSHLGGGIWF